jgi:CubicO group peptidase (beta-lactamase class C family)
VDRSAFLTAAGAFVLTARGRNLPAWQGASAEAGRIGARPRFARPRPRVSPTPYFAYEGAPQLQNQEYFNYFFSRGYRMISQSVYGGPENPRYACIWVQRGGPPFGAITGIDFGGYFNWLAYNAPFGFVPSHLAVTGDANRQVVAGIIEAAASVEYHVYHNQTATQFMALDAQFRDQGLTLQTAAIYGSKATPLYAAVWVDNAGLAPCSTRSLDSAATLTAAVAGAKAKGYRPIGLSLTDDQAYLSYYRADSVGAWTEEHNLTPAAYKALEKSMAASGYIPISLQGGGAGSSARYAAIFAKTDEATPAGAKLTITGAPVTALSQLDARVAEFMAAGDVRAGQLSVAKNGVVKFARAYTWAKPGYPITQPASLMRLAGVSKAFTVAAIQTLYDAKRLTPRSAVFPLLGLRAGADSRSDAITVEHLLEHQGGYDRSQPHGDPVFQLRQIALDLGRSAALTRAEFVRWVYGTTLDFTPGTATAYSNVGYVLLGALIEAVTGMPYATYVQAHVLRPLGINAAGLAQSRTRADLRLPSEVLYDDPRSGPSAAFPKSAVPANYCYGGEGWLTEVIDSAAGLCADASTVALLAHSYPAWGSGSRSTLGAAYAERTGSLAGVSSVLASRGYDGVDWAFTFNSRAFPVGAAPTVAELANDINYELDSNPL